MSEAVLFVCQKCGKSDSRRLVDDLKGALKKRGLKGEYRVAMSSCMRVCPDRGIAIAVTGRTSEFIVSEGDADDVLDHVTGKRRS